MNCKDYASALVCKDAQDPKYREQVQSGEIAFCDFHPRPDGTLTTVSLSELTITD